MANFTADSIISTAGGDGNGDFSFPKDDQPKLPPGRYFLSIAGTWGSRTITVENEDRSGNQTTAVDWLGNSLATQSSNFSTIVPVAEKLNLLMAGTGTAFLTVTLTRID